MSDDDPVIEVHDEVTVVRDDLYPGGTKARILPPLIAGLKEVVFGGPFCGGAPVALSVVGRALGVKVTLFFAERKNWHPRQLLSQHYGATLIPVPIGRIGKVQSHARLYCAAHGATFFPLGYDNVAARAQMKDYMHAVRVQVGPLARIYLAMGTGMLAKCAAEIWPEAIVEATSVGLRSRSDRQQFPSNVEITRWTWPLDRPSQCPVPFPCDPYYDRKAWATMLQQRPRGRVLFWNVLGEPERENPWPAPAAMKGEDEWHSSR